jgi:DNA-binding MarR family transcriptional regulator
MDPSSMVSTIDELEAKGLVERRPHPTDRRAYALHITDPGREALTRGRKVAGEAQRELLAPLSDVERETLQGLLLRLSGFDSESAPGPGGVGGAGSGGAGAG